LRYPSQRELGYWYLPEFHVYFSFNIISYAIPVTLYRFGAIDYRIESTMCCPKIPSL